MDSQLFSKKSDAWQKLHHASAGNELTRHACYASREVETYVRFQDQCHKLWERAMKI